MATQKVSKLRHQKGFTVMETMMTLAIAAILTGIAVPSMKDLTRNVTITTEVNGLIAAMHLARAEAGKRGTRVALCRSADPLATTPSCGGSTQNWSTGWLVYSVGNSRADPVYNTGLGDVLLAKGKPSGTGLTIMSSDSANENFEFNADGSTNEGIEGIFAFCDTRGEAYGKQISILPVGRPSVATSVDCTPA